MTCHDFLTLLNRDVDGRTSPEEEALLMQHIGTCPSCAAEQRVQHRIHHALLGLRSDDFPEGLGARIADAVVKAGTFGASGVRAGAVGASDRGSRWWRAGALGRQAAAVLLTAALAGITGWYVGQDDRPVVAAPTLPAEQRAQEHAIWVDAYRLPSAAADRILGAKAHYATLRSRMPDPSHQHELHEQETAEILRILAEFPRALESYRRNAWISEREYDRLLALARR